MQYSPISLNPDEVPSCVTELVSRQVDPLLRDIFCMLEHPRYNPDAEPGFNLSAASILFGIIGGLSRVFCNEITGDKVAFLQVLEYYPIGGPDNSIAIEEFAPEMYGIYRCNLVHALGLNTSRSKPGARWQIESLSEEKKVTRHSDLPLSVGKLVELNDQTVRPDWLEATLARTDGVVRLNVDALYWGVRRLIQLVATDSQRQKTAANLLEPLFTVARGTATTASTPTSTRHTDSSRATMPSQKAGPTPGGPKE